MLQVSGLSKYYGRVVALKNISFSIPTGSVTGLIGPNGAGKSTLLKILTGFESANSGTLKFHNKYLRSLSSKISHFSFMPENIKLYPDEQVGEFIKFLCDTGDYPNNDYWVKHLGLKPVFKRKIKDLSKGYHQRLKLFFALANQKPFVVLDEPFDGFDPRQLRDILTLIQNENDKGRGFLLSLHQLEISEKICNYFLLIDEGQIIQTGTLPELCKRFGEDRLEEIFLRVIT